MNASTGDRKTSGFSVPIENKSDISFNYHRISRLDSSGSVLSRPRLAKVRRHLGSDYPRSSPHPTDSRVNIDFNPFQTVCGNTNLISSGSEMSVSIEAKMADCDGKWDSSRKLEKEMADGMRKLRIESRKGVVNATDGGLRVNSYAGDKGVFIFESGSGKSSKDEGRELLNELKKLSIGNIDMNLGLNDENHGEKVGNSFAQSVNKEISNEFKELNIKGPTAVQGSDNLIFSANVLRNDAFKNPKKGTNSSVESLADTLPEQMMNLNMKEPSSGNKFVKNTARRTETLLSHRMKNVKIGSGKKNHDNQTDTCVFYPRFSSNEIDNEISNVKLYEKSISPTRSFQVSEGKDFSGSQVNLDGSHVNTKSTSSVSSSGTQFRLSDNVSVRNSRDGPEGKYDLGFGSKENESDSVNIEFNPHNPIFSGLNEQIEFSARREALNSTKSKKKRGKSAQPIKLWFSQDFVQARHISEENQESLVSYSPMDMSPYSETSGNLQSPRGTCAVPPNPLNSVQGIDSHPEASNDAIEEGLVYATKLLNINKFDVKYAESGQGHFDSYSDKNVGIGNFAEESVSGTETESFKSAIDDLDVDDDNTVTTEATVSGSALNLERQEGDSWTHCNFSSSSEDAGKTTFTFSASSSPVQVKSPSQSRFTRRKNLKAGSILYNSTPDLNVPNVLSPMEFHSVSAPSFLSPQQSQDRDSFLQHNSGTTKDKKTEKESVFSQEACEEWRLRGNKAYAQGDLSIAEDYYTRGIICISRCETSRSCLRALMLCYSNRAATRISLGRIKEALEDFMVATAIDPNFLKVQVRAANCYLSLGEVEEATQCYKRCLQSGRDVCIDKKVLMEASEGLQRAQKVSDYMNRFAEFMRQKRPSDAECALEIISEALVISSNSEKLLEMKAEALLVMRKYEEVIQLCEESLSSAEKNFINLNVDNQITILDSTVLLKRFSFRIWRCRLVFMSLYHLGKLEEALHLLEKQDWCPVEWEGSRTLESLLPLASTVRDLLCHKSAGNEAFQSGQFAEAVEHYTSALTCNVESRPFAAVCFCNRAAAYKALGQISDAIADCSLAMALDRNYVKAISRRSILFAMIRDYGQATSDLQRLVSVLVNQLEDKTNQLGLSNRSTYSSNDLRQAQLQLSEMEEEAKKQTPLNMYLILGVEPSVSASEIKKAYRKAALKHHPDKASQSLPRCDNGDDALWKEIVEEVREDAEKLFKMIGEAYAVLSEPMKRAEYDLGEEMRNDRKRSNANNSSGTRADSPCDPFERNRSRTQWRDIYRSYGYSHSRASEANRTYRYSGL